VICLSDAYRQVSESLDMEVTDLGPTQLKNIESPGRWMKRSGVSTLPMAQVDYLPIRGGSATRRELRCPVK
jgi:hypothetical protein